MQNIVELVDEATACKIIGGASRPIHRATLWRGIKAGRFPKPVKVGPGTNRWLKSELIELIEQAAAARRHATEGEAA